MKITIKEMLDASELNDDQKKRYKKAQVKAEACKTKAEAREDIDTDLIRTRVGNEDYISSPEKPATYYWSGFLNGLTDRILFTMSPGPVANSFKDVPMTEMFRGYIAGYMLCELSDHTQNAYGPRKVEPPDCPPIIY